MWQPYEEGRTIGQTGTEGGVIIHDEEHHGGARITLERGALHAPFAITCGVYGWMVHTRFLADDETAEHSYSAMRLALGSIVLMLPDSDDDDGDQIDAVIAQFVEQFA
jgi:hypothetical protein